MPPPKKIYRVGTKECEQALVSKHIFLSLPMYQNDGSGNNSNENGRVVKKRPKRWDVSPLAIVQEQLLHGGDDNKENAATIDSVNSDRSNSDCIFLGTQKGNDDENSRSTSYDFQPDPDESSSVGCSDDVGIKVQDDATVVSQEDDNSTAAVVSKSPGEDERKKSQLATPKFQLPDPTLPRFSDIIGHGPVKLRIEEALLPIALPDSIAKSVLTGELLFVHECMAFQPKFGIVLYAWSLLM